MPTDEPRKSSAVRPESKIPGEEGLLDMILVAFNFSQPPSYRENVTRYLASLSASLDFVTPQPELPRLLARAHAAGVGVMVMKTLKGARLNGMRRRLWRLSFVVSRRRAHRRRDADADVRLRLPPRGDRCARIHATARRRLGLPRQQTSPLCDGLQRGPDHRHAQPRDPSSAELGVSSCVDRSAPRSAISSCCSS